MKRSEGGALTRLDESIAVEGEKAGVSKKGGGKE